MSGDDDGDLIRLGSLEQIRVGVGRHPGATVFSLLKDVLGGRSQGVPGPWRRTVRRTVPSAAVEMVRPVFTSGDCRAPDCLALTQTIGTTSTVRMATVLDELDGLSPQALSAEVESCFGGTPPRGWQPVLERPRAFLAAYRQLVIAVWDTFAPLWARADPLLTRETERIGTATVSEHLDTVLAGLGTPLRYTGGALRLPHPNPGPARPAELGPRRLLLVPLASGHRAAMYDLDRPDLIWIGYPLPGLATLADRTAEAPAPNPGDPLILLLGQVRAAILRHTAHHPSVTDVARHLRIAVSTATYHCDHLTAAGLLHRERRGREVRLHRTERGAALVELLSAGDVPERAGADGG